MRVFVATAGDEPYHDAQRQVFMDLARADEVGEHSIETDPARANAILFVDLHQHPEDPFLARLRRHDLVRAHRDKVFVYDERDLPFFTFPGVYVGGTPRIARRRPVAGGPYPVLLNPSAPGAQEPDLLYSFVGSRNHPVREALLRLQHERGLARDVSGLNFFGPQSADEDVSRARAEYSSIIRRSKFILCPRGHGPSSFRLYEALGAARVPVIISDDWLPPPGVEWSDCVVRVPQSDVAGIPELLERLESSWAEMVRAGRHALQEHLGPSRLWHHYCASLELLRPGARSHLAPWWAQSSVVRIQARRLRGAVRHARP